MMVIEKDGNYYIGRLRLDTNRRELWLNDEIVNLSRQRFDVLLYLIENHKRNVEKKELLENIWGKDVFVEEGNIARIISELRDKLGDDAILTEHGVGYRFNPNHFIEGDNLKCPWRGLRFYDEASEVYFCGRDEDVNEIIERLRTNPFLLTLTGSSGVGKTSLVRAGLIPRLKRGEDIEESSVWKYLSLRPTRRPLFELSKKLPR